MNVICWIWSDGSTTNKVGLSQLGDFVSDINHDEKIMCWLTNWYMFTTFTVCIWMPISLGFSFVDFYTCVNKNYIVTERNALKTEMHSFYLLFILRNGFLFLQI